MKRAELDVTDSLAVERAVRDVDVVVHLGALTNVDRCEAEPELAYSINADGTRNVAVAADGVGARVIYLSTDYVFDGTKAGEYTEEDEPAPINQYGRSKLEGERHVASVEGNLIVRTSWVFGEGRNFIRTILGAARDRDVLQVVGDQRGRPTYAGDLARALAALVVAPISGIVHIAGDGAPCSWAELAEAALAAAESHTRVDAIDSDTYRATADRLIAPRPPNSTLSLEKATRLGLPLFDWRDSARSYVQTMRDINV